MLGLARHVQLALAFDFKVPFGVEGGFLCAAGAVHEGVDGAFHQLQLNALAAFDVDGGAFRAGEVHAVEVHRQLIRPVEGEGAVGRLAFQHVEDFLTRVGGGDGHVPAAGGVGHALDAGRDAHGGVRAAPLHFHAVELGLIEHNRVHVCHLVGLVTYGERRLVGIEHKLLVCHVEPVAVEFLADIKTLLGLRGQGCEQ